MHSTIYQIGTKPIAESDILLPDNIVAGEMASISYIYEDTEEGREHDIKCLVEDIFPKGMFTLSAKDTLTYNGGFMMWRKTHYDNIKALSAQLTPANVMNWDGPIRLLKKAISNPLGTAALFVTEFYGGGGTAECSADFMDMVSNMKKGEKLYLGAILGYHF